MPSPDKLREAVAEANALFPDFNAAAHDANSYHRYHRDHLSSQHMGMHGSSHDSYSNQLQAPVLPTPAAGGWVPQQQQMFAPMLPQLGSRLADNQHGAASGHVPIWPAQAGQQQHNPQPQQTTSARRRSSNSDMDLGTDEGDDEQSSASGSAAPKGRPGSAREQGVLPPPAAAAAAAGTHGAAGNSLQRPTAPPVPAAAAAQQVQEDVDRDPQGQVLSRQRLEHERLAYAYGVMAQTCQGKGGGTHGAGAGDAGLGAQGGARQREGGAGSTVHRMRAAPAPAPASDPRMTGRQRPHQGHGRRVCGACHTVQAAAWRWRDAQRCARGAVAWRGVCRCARPKQSFA
jgi:hypothetical protein